MNKWNVSKTLSGGYLDRLTDMIGKDELKKSCREIFYAHGIHTYA